VARLAEHSGEILREAGVSDAEIEELVLALEQANGDLRVPPNAAG
jgi:hypothetical protein